VRPKRVKLGRREWFLFESRRYKGDPEWTMQTYLNLGLDTPGPVRVFVVGGTDHERKELGKAIGSTWARIGGSQA
jgi:hypothetical protein